MGDGPVLNIVLVEPEIPPNAGNVGRLCAATRSRLHLVKPLGFSLDDRHLRRAGLDYWEHVDLACWDGFPALREAHPSGKFHYFTSRVCRPYTQAPFARGDFLVFGRETAGLPDAMVLSNLDSAYCIPMWGKVRCLNLSTSVGVVAYEALRRITPF